MWGRSGHPRRLGGVGGGAFPTGRDEVLPAGEPAPGRRPMTASSTETRPRTAADTWLADFADGLEARDVDRAAALFADGSFWRDLVAFSWNIPTVEGRDGVADLLRATLDRTDPPASPPPRTPTEADGVTDGLDRVRDRGRPRPRAPAAAATKALDTAHHARTSSRGTRSRAGARRPKGVEHGADKDRLTWLERREAEAAELGVHDAAVRRGRRRRAGRHRARRPAAPARRAGHRDRQARRGPATSGASRYK